MGREGLLSPSVCTTTEAAHSSRRIIIPVHWSKMVHESSWSTLGMRSLMVLQTSRALVTSEYKEWVFRFEEQTSWPMVWISNLLNSVTG